LRLRGIKVLAAKTHWRPREAARRLALGDVFAEGANITKLSDAVTAFERQEAPNGMVLLLLLAFVLTSGTVIIHAFGTLAAIAHLGRIWQHTQHRRGRLAAEVQVIRAVSLLLLLHLAEASLWASVYRLIGLLPDLETAIYFSITSYTTVGYGDVVLPAPWRLIGPVEGAVGILMFGWSTALMVNLIGKVYGDQLAVQPDTTTAGSG